MQYQLLEVTFYDYFLGV